MDAYSQTISYQCGDPLFEEGIEDSPDNAAFLKLKETFFIREANWRLGLSIRLRASTPVTVPTRLATPRP